MSLVCCEHREFRFGDRRVVLDVERNSLYEVEEAASRILSRLRVHPADEEELARELVDGGPPEIALEALAELKELKLVAEDSPRPTTFEVPPVAAVRALCLLVVHDCTMRCRYCYGSGGSYGTRGQSMSRSTAIRAVEFLLAEIPRGNTGSVHFSGGEPLLRWDLLQEVIPYIRRREAEEAKPISLSITTNGTLLNQEIIGFLHDHRVYTGISLDGPAEIHDRMRVLPDGSGSYEFIVPKIQQLSQGQQGFVVRATLDPSDPQMARVVDHLLQLGAAFIYFEPASDVLGTDAGGLSSQAVDKLRRGYRELKEKYIRTIQVESRLLPIYSFVRILRLLTRSGQRVYYGCRMGRSYVAVSAGGRFYPCHRLVGQAEYALGDLQSGLPAQARERFRALHVQHREACRGCWARYLCGGGCYYEGVVTQGDVEHPDPAHCELTREIIVAAIEIALGLSRIDRLEIDAMAERFKNAVGHPW